MSDCSAYVGLTGQGTGHRAGHTEGAPAGQRAGHKGRAQGRGQGMGRGRAGQVHRFSNPAVKTPILPPQLLDPANLKSQILNIKPTLIMSELHALSVVHCRFCLEDCSNGASGV